MTDPAAAPDPAPPRVRVDPEMVLRRIAARSELGASMVHGASMEVLAEHYAAEVDELRKQVDAAGSAPSDGDPADG